MTPCAASYQTRVGSMPGISATPDLPGFIRHVAPALERRLATSVVAGYTGEVKLSFYRSGLRLAFHHGTLQAAEAWTPTPDERGLGSVP